MGIPLRALAVGLSVAAGLAILAAPASAIEEFYTQLEAKYVKPASKKQNDVLLTIAFEEAHCKICHPGDDKHKLTPYGGALAWRVNKYDKKDKKKIQAAIEEVGKLRSNPQDPKSPTYGELFREGRLPPSQPR